jgi:hypothetical protein
MILAVVTIVFSFLVYMWLGFQYVNYVRWAIGNHSVFWDISRLYVDYVTDRYNGKILLNRLFLWGFVFIADMIIDLIIVLVWLFASICSIFHEYIYYPLSQHWPFRRTHPA